MVAEVRAVFVKKSWSYYKGKRYTANQLVESYRDPSTGQTRHRVIMNLGDLPQHVIDAIDQSLKMGKTVVGTDIKVSSGDTVTGAGLMSIYRQWKLEGLDRVLGGLTEAQRQSVLAMVAQRILNPGSKLALKDALSDSILAISYSKKRLCENELYRVMDVLDENFYEIQKKLMKQRDVAPVLLLYDTTSTYFEGRCAEDGQYGYSRDKRWDRYQVVIGLVCDGDGIPLAVELWPGNTADRSTVCSQVKSLRERFGIEKAVFVGDKGMHLDLAIEDLEELGLDYILSVDWREERRQLLALDEVQLELFDRVGIVQWQEGDVRYVGCSSEFRKERAVQRRETGMERAREQLEKLSSTCAQGRYYSWVRLREKVNEILKSEGVSGLWRVEISPLEETKSPEDKARLGLTFEPDETAIERRKLIEGKYVLQTSVPKESLPAEEVDRAYRQLHKVERAWRHIKSYLKIRPVYHRLKRRIRAHVLICFLAFYLVKKMELDLREQGQSRDVEPLLRYWDKLRLTQFEVKVGKHSRREWQWSLGDIGQGIKEEINALGWWRSLDAHRRSLLNA